MLNVILLARSSSVSSVFFCVSFSELGYCSGYGPGGGREAGGPCVVLPEIRS